MSNKTFKWAVIGAGGAGIAAVGKLIDHHINPDDILWIDPYFQVGDLGKYWQNVNSNTSVKCFIDFLTAVTSFNYDSRSAKFQINQIPTDETCTLDHIVKPLEWITNQLKNRVFAAQTMLHHIKLYKRKWALQCDSENYLADNVILANGAVPDYLHYPEINTIPFHIGIDKKLLSENLNRNKTYAVFGSSHSAIIIIKHLVDLEVKKIINFYRNPCRYAIKMEDWTLFDNTGLKGKTAQWARDYIDGKRPANLERYPADATNVAAHLPDCDHAIYAVGFNRRNNIVIDEYEQANYNPQTGIIAPGLFGLGIAYPEAKLDPFGILEHQVGLWKFMVYLNKIMPLWLKYHT